jgi:hypothetical protein
MNKAFFTVLGRRSQLAELFVSLGGEESNKAFVAQRWQNQQMADLYLLTPNPVKTHAEFSEFSLTRQLAYIYQSYGGVRPRAEIESMTKGQQMYEIYALLGGAKTARFFEAQSTSQQLADIYEAVVAGGGVNTASDDFNRANGAIGGEWTVYSGGFNILSNELVGTSAGFAKNLAIHSVDVGSINQWVRLTYKDASGAGFLGPVFRFVDENSPHYENDFNGNACYFTYSEDVAYTANSADNIIDGTTSPAWPGINFSPTIVGTTLEGVGNSTIIRYWFWAANTPPAELEPTSPSLWNGEAPFITVTTDPARSADIGTRVGVCAFHAVTSAVMDDWAAGGF